MRQQSGGEALGFKRFHHNDAYRFSLEYCTQDIWNMYSPYPIGRAILSELDNELV